MPIKKAQTLLVTLALVLAVFAPLWHSSPHHTLPGERADHPGCPEGTWLVAAAHGGSDAGGACPVCLHQRLLNQSFIENVAVVSAPAQVAHTWLEPDSLPVSHRSLPPGARAPPTC